MLKGNTFISHKNPFPWMTVILSIGNILQVRYHTIGFTNNFFSLLRGRSFTLLLVKFYFSFFFFYFITA